MRLHVRSLGLATILLGLTVASLLAADAVKGKEIYDKKCAMCHGKDLKGNPAMAKSFKLDPSALSLVTAQVQNQTDADLIATTTKGKGKMPAQTGKMTPEDIAHSVAYMRAAGAPAK